MNAPEKSADLRYLEAASVRCAAGSLSNFRVCTEDSQPLGTLHGVLINPAERRLEYFVIDTPGFLSHRQYLLSADTGATVQDARTLQISARRDELELEAFNPRSVPGFSDDDVIRSIFPS